MMPYGYLQVGDDPSEPERGYRPNLMACSHEDCKRTDGYHEPGCPFRADYEDDFSS